MWDTLKIFWRNLLHLLPLSAGVAETSWSLLTLQSIIAQYSTTCFTAMAILNPKQKSYRLHLDKTYG